MRGEMPAAIHGLQVRSEVRLGPRVRFRVAAKGMLGERQILPDVVMRTPSPCCPSASPAQPSAMPRRCAGSRRTGRSRRLPRRGFVKVRSPKLLQLGSQALDLRFDLTLLLFASRFAQPAERSGMDLAQELGAVGPDQREP